MNSTTEAAIRAFVRLHKMTETLYSDPHHPGVEEGLTNTAQEANKLMGEAGLLGQPDHVIFGLVREVYPGWRPSQDPDATFAVLIPGGPLNAPPADPRQQLTGVATTREDRERILRAALSRAGVGELGKYDQLVIGVLAEASEWPMLATIASWIERAGDKPSGTN